MSHQEQNELFNIHLTDRLTGHGRAFFNPEYRTSVGLSVAGWENPIEILPEPRVMGDERFGHLLQLTADADSLLNKAAAHTLSQPKARNNLLSAVNLTTRRFIEARFSHVWDQSGSAQKMREIIEGSSYFRRMDNLLQQKNEANGSGISPIELNGNCPEGPWYYTAARQIYARAYGIEINSIPDVVAPLYDTLSGARNLFDATVAIIADPEDRISPVELPLLTEALNAEARNRNEETVFIYAETPDVEVGSGGVFVHGAHIDTIWRNWGRTIPDHIAEAVLEGQVAMVNQPETGVSSQKILFATVTTDQEFRSTLGEGEIELADSFFPETHALTTHRDIEEFVNRPDADTFYFKPSEGSSGEGGVHGKDLDQDAVEQMKDTLASGNVPLAQKVVGSPEPDTPTRVIEGNTIVSTRTFTDFDPYIFNTSRGKQLGPVVTRSKNVHPINVAQGGMFSVVVPASAV